MEPSEVNNKDHLVDTWANKAMQARGEESIVSGESTQIEDSSSLADTWANKADKVRANADKFNQVEGKVGGTLNKQFNDRRERIKHLAETATKDESKPNEKVA